MLGFSIFIFIGLLALLTRNSKVQLRSSVIQSLVVLVCLFAVVYLFSVFTLGIIFFLGMLFITFWAPFNRSKTKFYFKQEDMFKDFFEEVRRQQHYQHQSQGQRRQESSQHYQRRESVRPRSQGMSVQEASKLLGLPVNATVMQIKSAYRKLMLKHHPDKGGSVEFATKLNIARDTLMSHAQK